MRTRQILCPTDFSETASHALGYAIEMANLYQVNIRLLHVMSKPYGEHHYDIVVESVAELETQLEAYSNEKLDALVKEIEPQLTSTLQVKTAVRSGDTFAQILEDSIESDVGMIVIASHGHTGLSHMLNPNVSEKLANKAKCPVLVVK
ncbi:universal stress protein [Shewanella pealeana]|uniref:UspA domain protein n=1 Tax=Shewanella pealeana (strain ATCC 700345 / ANG-SQ1) TaxID=398579 RepID=A8H2V7_SHEPA|nr:universal stress protein [Shewanella pealeana]ABV86894.1 UspA domain protein [Shewanella pealeana ATCC 700345]